MFNVNFLGNLDMVKLLAGNYSVPVNVKSHGGYTPLHLACQFGHQVKQFSGFSSLEWLDWINLIGFALLFFFIDWGYLIEFTLLDLLAFGLFMIKTITSSRSEVCIMSDCETSKKTPTSIFGIISF